MAHFLHEPDAVFKSLTVAAKTRNQNLFQSVDFSNSLFEMDNRFFMQIPGKSVSWTTFSDVFEIYFWVVLFFAAVILTLAIYAIYQGPIPLIFFLSGQVKLLIKKCWHLFCSPIHPRLLVQRAMWV